MIGSPMEMRAFTQDLAHSVWTLGAIGALLESGVAAHLTEPRSLDELASRSTTLSRSRIERCLGVAAAAGVVVEDGGKYRLADGAMPFAQPPGRTSLQGDIRAHLTQVLAFLDAKNATDVGWHHTNPALLQSQGDASSAFAAAFKGNIAAMLGDLATRLDQPGARFLDVGVGVGSLAIAMCRCFPTLHTLGLDVFDVPLEMARANVKQANLTERIELRQLAVEKLREEAAFDFAWLPSMFIPEAALPEGAARICASLRPGGWVIVPVGGFVGDARARESFALLIDFWGGPVLSTTDAESLLKTAGFSTTRVLPGPPFIPPIVVAQR